MRQHRRVRMWACGGSVGLSVAGALAQTAQFAPLPTLSSSAGARGSWAYGVNSNGTIIVGASMLKLRTGVERRAALWRWSAGGVPSAAEALPWDPTFATQACAVSDDGERVVGTAGFLRVEGARQEYSPQYGAYWWDRHSAHPQWDTVPGTMELRDITADGTLVVGTLRDPTYFEPLAYQAVKWRGPTNAVEWLPDFDDISLVGGCSRDGAVIVGAGLNLEAPSPVPGIGVINGLIWDELGTHPIEEFDAGEWHEILGVSGNGEWLTGPTNSGSFVWSKGKGIIPIPPLPTGGTLNAVHVSNDGGVVIGDSSVLTDTGWESEACIWRPDRGTRRLASELADRGVAIDGWRLQSATAMSVDGTVIAGYGINAAGEPQGFAVRLIGPAPCPCSADFDASGGTPDIADIAAYFDAWLAGDPRADADCSGGTPDTADIDVFFTAWLNGGC